jgi:hypothetical protein
LVDVISSPIWSTASGLLLHGRTASETRPRVTGKSMFGVRSVMGSLRGMFQDLL